MLLLISVIILLVAAIFFIKRIQTYWRRQGVEEIEPKFLVGNVLDVVTYKQSWGQLLLDVYKEFKRRSVDYGGIYTFLKPTFVPLDPKIIKNILVKDFQSFSHRGLYINEEFEPLSGNLFTLDGKRWKLLRTLLIRAFTPNQVGEQFNSLISYTSELKKILFNSSNHDQPVNIQSLVPSFTSDAAVGCLLGIRSNSLTNPQSTFNKYGKKVTELTWQKCATLAAAQIMPNKVCGLLGLRFTEMKIQNFFLEITKSTIEQREKSEIFRKDLISTMLQPNCYGQDKELSFTDQKHYDLNEIAAQSFIAFIGGYETTATALKLSLYELALNQEIQNILRNDIEAALKKHNGQLSVKSLSDMEYLDGVVLESLRKYPVCPVILRSCSKRYQVPETNVILDKGTLVNIPVLGLHMDPNYHPDPEKFNPSRFNKENRKHIKEFTFLPFGVGPRMCVGYRFGTLVIKMGIIEFIRNYKITINETTKMPVKISPNSFFVTIKDNVWINLTKILNE